MPPALTSGGGDRPVSAFLAANSLNDDGGKSPTLRLRARAAAKSSSCSLVLGCVFVWNRRTWYGKKHDDDRTSQTEVSARSLKRWLAI